MKTTMEDIRNMIKTLQIVEMVGSMTENEDEVAQNFADTFMRKIIDENMIEIRGIAECRVCEIEQDINGKMIIYVDEINDWEDDDDDDWEDDEEDDEEEVVIDIEALKAFKDALREFCMA